jgi:hypothetical protein
MLPPPLTTLEEVTKLLRVYHELHVKEESVTILERNIGRQDDIKRQ